ncbi:3-deoxy-7-phosphoheptulonate synthase [Vibrio sp. OCN044]|uniref:Phospho-2-dehydro-3-deoxyheptonate aldolase n=1 Tax=Vibrio tetraodonis subsp. pristinus TaxID=2695891 RepID=A0A6L8LY68_9VIBR|nr:3-deoxy-7-phosphoheptulonate synthase [Vibrio tetraodonis]MYM58152.1 3-deoxy-7-phosphoheptulonate synthase [Vibrio tetraodonis subsp. pristinus]
MNALHNVINAKSLMPLPNLESILGQTNNTSELQRFIVDQRKEIAGIISGDDPRLLVIIGPCSIHDPNSAIEYATRLSKIQSAYKDTLKLVMRTYFEKPRTRNGWKGFIVDPDLNGEFNILSGIYRSRQLMQSILELGIPTANEFLDPNIALYIADLVCWGAIGARTTESQPHRQLASGLQCPIGFKNGTNGNVDISIDAIHAAHDSHLLLAKANNNQDIAIQTQGNNNCHIILRGGIEPNYSSKHVKKASQQLINNDLSPRVVIDCSHANSGKIAKNQLSVGHDIALQIALGEKNIAGVMCESFLNGGNQKINHGVLNYGQSITDECLDWEDTLVFLDQLNEAVKKQNILTAVEA